MSRPFARLLARSLTVIALVFSLSGLVAAQPEVVALEEGFRVPPESAKPRVWWHWMNGNVTKEGITADLEWMQRVGIGGMQMFDGMLNTPQLVEKRLVWMTPEWKDALRHAAAEADRLGLEMGMAASGGWSQTGGPTVKPEQAMKKLVWSETPATGPGKFSEVLAPPPRGNGTFQNPVDQASKEPTFYAEAKVVAYRELPAERKMTESQPKLTSSIADFDLAPLVDGNRLTSVAIPFPGGVEQHWIQLEFDQPYTAYAFAFAGVERAPFSGWQVIPGGTLETSNDGKTWITLASLDGVEMPFTQFPLRTYAFPETTARYFRLLVKRPKSKALTAETAPVNNTVDISELELTATPRVHRWHEKAQFSNMVDLELTGTPDYAAKLIIPVADVIDLTGRMQPDGRLEWDVPAGRWVILRMGYSLTGAKNGPGTPESTGLEVDKLSRPHVEAYLRDYTGQIAEAIGPHYGRSFRYLLMDSWEAGMENWTDDMASQFTKRRGYDPTPWLPVLTGRLVGSSELSDRFLWDFRRTIADLLADHHYEAATGYLGKSGVGIYAEAVGVWNPTTGDGLQAKGRVSIPMGEFWVPFSENKDTPAETLTDLKEASSAAHIFGQKIVAAESFTSMPSTSMWGQAPFDLKALADRAFAKGINRIVIHESAAQPFVDDKHKPGMTLGWFGQNYTRNITWAEQAVAWNHYLARCSHLLQQGLFVGDLAYYGGTGAPSAVPFWKPLSPAPPPGYDYDWVNTEVLLERMVVKDGRLILPDGMSYAALVVPEDINLITLPVAQKIGELAKAGAIVIAPRPKRSPSLEGYPGSDPELQAIISEVWGGIDGTTITHHDLGGGRVYWGKPVADILAAKHTPVDFEPTRSAPDAQFVWIHRRAGDTDLYFVSNQQNRPEEIQATFRVSGKEAELWHADTGKIEPAAYAIANGRTTVPLQLEPHGSVFVVFRQPAKSNSRVLPRPVVETLATLGGAWRLSFPPEWGAPPQVELPELISWTDSSDTGVKYFSGTATYAKEFDVPPEWLQPAATLQLDLGRVEEIAEVSVNGQPVGGILWKPPFRTELSAALKPGRNRLEIKVTNLWPNRIIGDRQPDAKQTYTFMHIKPYRSESRLTPSGLLGPVRILRSTTK